MKQVYGIWFPESDTHFQSGFMHENGDYQRDTFDCAVSYVQKPKAFIDIGAHVGLWTLMAARAGFQGINAFEPNPITYECLEKNILENIKNAKDSKIKIVTHNYGVSSKKENLFIHNDAEGNSGAISLRSEGKHKVKANALDNIKIEYCDYDGMLPHELLVKIDTEGMELQCVEGMRKLLLYMRPVVCIERRTSANALMILQQMGMQIVQQVRKDYILTWKN